MDYLQIIFSLNSMSVADRMELATELLNEVEETGETCRVTEFHWLAERGYMD